MVLVNVNVFFISIVPESNNGDRIIHLPARPLCEALRRLRRRRGPGLSHQVPTQDVDTQQEDDGQHASNQPPLERHPPVTEHVATAGRLFVLALPSAPPEGT